MAGGPTDHFANERTFLAWVRTSITIIGLGFVVARFGLFLRIATGTGGNTSPISEVVGVFLVLAGAALVAVAMIRFRRVQQELKEGRYEVRSDAELVLSGALIAVGVCLGAYLLLTG